MEFSTLLRFFVFAILALFAVADFDDTPYGVEFDYYPSYVKKGGPQGPLRFGKRRGPSGPLRFGKRSAAPSISVEPVWAGYNQYNQ